LTARIVLDEDQFSSYIGFALFFGSLAVFIGLCFWTETTAIIYDGLYRTDETWVTVQIDRSSFIPIPLWPISIA